MLFAVANNHTTQHFFLVNICRKVVLFINKHFVRLEAYEPGSHMYAMLPDFGSLNSTELNIFPSKSIMVCLDSKGNLVSPSTTLLSREVLLPGSTGFQNEHEVQHTFLDGHVQVIPKLSTYTITPWSRGAVDQKLQWYLPDKYSSHEGGYIARCNGSRSFDLSFTYDYVVPGKNHMQRSGTAQSWIYKYETANSAYPNCTITGSGYICIRNGQPRYIATASCHGKMNSEVKDRSFSIDVPIYIKASLGVVLGNVAPNIPHPPSYFEGMYDVPDTLGTDIYDKIAIPHVNNVENLKDNIEIFKSKDLRKVMPPIRDLLVKHNIKSVAQFYLWYHYAASPTVGDIKEYITYFRKLADRKLRSVDYETINLAYKNKRFKVVISPYEAGLIESLGLMPSLGNTWDCLPLSFILDWFVNVGDVLASIDAQSAVSQIHVIQITQSYKKIGMLVLPDLMGSIRYSYYERRLSSTIPQSVVRLHANDPSKHLLDAGSLYCSFRK